MSEHKEFKDAPGFPWCQTTNIDHSRGVITLQPWQCNNFKPNDAIRLTTKDGQESRINRISSINDMTGEINLSNPLDRKMPNPLDVVKITTHSQTSDVEEKKQADSKLDVILRLMEKEKELRGLSERIFEEHKDKLIAKVREVEKFLQEADCDIRGKVFIVQDDTITYHLFITGIYRISIYSKGI